MPYDINIREEELKNKISKEYFGEFDCTKIIGNVDFCVMQSPPSPEGGVFDVTSPPSGDGGLSLLWAEAKKGSSDIYKSIVQLILTIGKARTFEKVLPPSYLGAFDAEKIAFIPYNDIQEIFYQNDFNWNVTPSNHETKEFKQVYDKVKTTIDNTALLFFYGKDNAEIAEFIRLNFIAGKTATSKIRIDKNNFITIYTKWLAAVKPTITVNWDIAKKNGIIDGDFYLADLLSSENESLKENLYVLLKKDQYQLDRKLNEMGMFSSQSTGFNDKQKAHTQFWNKYERPPKEQYWDYIVERRDLLVPQDVRERKGSFFTPQIWVELSQQYLADVLGEDWQDEYYIWDCAAGTGNLLTGLANKDNIWASTLDRQDVDVIKDRIQNGANLWEKQVFQFDFLNDSFEKLPKELREIVNNPEKRKKLVVYINPPYAEADNRRGEGRSGVAISAIHQKYSDKMGYTKREMYVQFLTRIYFEINGCKIAEFSKLKALQAPKFIEFRNFFKAKLEKCFIVPARTFDNVKGHFPIGFKIWDTDKKEDFLHIQAAAYNEKEKYFGVKEIWAYDNAKFINDWVKTFRKTKSDSIATIIGVGSDFQNQRLVRIDKPHMEVPADNHHWQITKENLIQSAIYYTVRKIIAGTWFNDRDQFLYPNEKWEIDKEFQHDCLTYTLFNNNIKSKDGTNHWIPFTEAEVNSHDKFESKFMAHFIAGKLKDDTATALFEKEKVAKKEPLKFSTEAKAVFEAGKALWKYYHATIQKTPTSGDGGLINASLYDIREYFQERNSAGRMNNKSTDETYTKLIAELRESLKVLAEKIEPKVYEYGFLKG